MDLEKYAKENNITERWTFGTYEADDLVDLVINGKKQATSSIYDGTEPNIGDISIITYTNGEIACIVKLTNKKILKFKDMEEVDALKEGEGTYAHWIGVHNKFFKEIDKSFNENTLILFEEFTVILP